MADPRSYTAGRFGLVLDGDPSIGYCKSVAGGVYKGEVATHQLGPDNVQKKHLATVKCEPITVECGMGMGKAWYEWIQNSFNKNAMRKNGELVAANFNYEAQRAIMFYNALMTELTLPAWDSKSKDSAYMTCKFDCEDVKNELRNGERIDNAKIGTAAKKWLCAAFKFELGSLPTAKVSKIDSLTWKQNIVEDPVGAMRVAEKVPAKVECPNLKITFSARDAGPWVDWHRTFVIEGQCTDSDELSGSLTWLAPNRKDELGRVNFFNVGIISLEPAKVEANKEEIASYTAECYFERAEFLFEGDGQD